MCVVALAQSVYGSLMSRSAGTLAAQFHIFLWGAIFRKPLRGYGMAFAKSAD
jgi:hypothetical protein